MRLLIFDLDGTLIDSKLDLAHSVNAARAYMEMPPLDHALIATYVGNGAPVLIRRAMGPEATQEEIDRALDFFIRYYAQHCLDFTILYPGVKEALDRLREAAVPMAILTNKPVRISHQIIQGLGLSEHFFRVYGGNSFGQKKPDPVGIDALLGECGLPRESAVMVGDSAVDIRTARNAKIQACGVTYGFQPESLKEAPPDMLVDDLRELADHVLGRQ